MAGAVPPTRLSADASSPPLATRKSPSASVCWGRIAGSVPGVREKHPL